MSFAPSLTSADVAGLTVEQLAELEVRGFVRVPSAVDATDASDMEARVWAWLEMRDGIDRHDRGTWPVEVAKLQPLRKAEVFNGFLNERTSEIAEALLGAGWHQFGVSPQALLSFPTDASWELPHKLWHFDLPARGPVTGFDALRFLGFVNDVGPRGGGTLVVEGSHQLVRNLVARSAGHDAGKSADVRRALARSSAWFAALSIPGGERIERFMQDGDVVDGVDVRVVELTGAPGDLVVMHPWVMHNISMNVADTPRMMTSFSMFNAEYLPYADTPER